MRVEDERRPLDRQHVQLLDPRLTGELEDDSITLADWLDRERMESLLDITDEIGAHQKRLTDLMAQYARTKDPRVLDEIERVVRDVEKVETAVEPRFQEHFVHAMAIPHETDPYERLARSVPLPARRTAPTARRPRRRPAEAGRKAT